MSLVPMNDMLRKANEGNYAVGQFNLNNLEFIQAILLASQQEASPVILGVSEAYIPYMGGLKTIVSMVRSLMEELRISVPVALHLDHGTTFDVCVRAMHEGFSSVMIDGSHLSLPDNIQLTRSVKQVAQVLGVSVEAELGRITGREDDLVVDEAEASYAVPDDCVLLVKETGVDCLAPALGSVHGPYRGQPKLGFDRMKLIRELTGVPLVLHGGSGLPDEEIHQAIQYGTAKVNVNTDNQMAFSAAVRKHLSEHPEAYDVRDYLKPARQAVFDSVVSKIRLFGSAGRA